MTKTLFIEKRGCDFWKDDLLKIINNLSCDKFTDIKFVEKV